MVASDQAAIINYWRAVELFSPQIVPRAAPNARPNPVFVAKEQVPLPWDLSAQPKLPKLSVGAARRFQVYCGIYSIQTIRRVLEASLGKDPESFDERNDGESCLFAFSVAEDGRPLFDSFVLSACAWALHERSILGPKALGG